MLVTQHRSSFVALTIAFAALWLNPAGAFAYRTVVEQGTPVPGTSCEISGGFDSGDNLAIQGTRIAFTAEYNCSGVGGGQGLFIEEGPGNLIQIITTDDMLDGSSVDELSTQFMTGLDGDRLGFSALLDNGDENAYLADLAASPITFTRVIGTGDTLPGGETLLAAAPPAVTSQATALGAGRFETDEENGQGLLTSISGVLALPISPSTPIPGAPGYVVFSIDSDLGIQEATSLGGVMVGAEVFLCPVADYDPVQGSCDVDDTEAVVTVQDGVLTNRADMLTTINPSSGELFVELDEPAVYDGAIAFCGDFRDSGERQEGIYTDCSGTLEKVVDSLDPVPGFPTYEFGAFSIDVGFKQNLTTIGEEIQDPLNPGPEHEMLLSAHPDGTLTDCANTITSTSPSTGELFADFNDAAVDGTTIAFWARDVNDHPALLTGTCGTLPAAGCSTPPESPLTITRATLWADASSPGRVTYEGIVEGIDPSSGLTFTVTDGLTTNQSGSVGPGDCVLQNSGTIKCVFKDPAVKKKKVKAAFRPTGNPGEYSFKLQMNKLSIPRPQAGPASLTIVETGGGSFAGSLASCDIAAKKMVCKN